MPNAHVNALSDARHTDTDAWTRARPHLDARPATPRRAPVHTSTRARARSDTQIPERASAAPFRMGPARHPAFARRSLPARILADVLACRASACSR
eukprot:6212532-Pleurochrysis_carterae.AAC.4